MIVEWRIAREPCCGIGFTLGQPMLCALGQPMLCALFPVQYHDYTFLFIAASFVSIPVDTHAQSHIKDFGELRL